MVEYRRAKMAGGTYFFTVVTQGRKPILTSLLVRNALRQGIVQARNTMPFSIEAWVLMPDHIHCVWTLPEDDDGYASRWAIIKRAVSQAWGHSDTRNHSQLVRGESGFWQRRYWEHLIRDDEDRQRHFDYIHWNPVKHGLVKRPLDWPYSTLQRYVREGVYSADWGVDPGDGDFGE